MKKEKRVNLQMLLKYKNIRLQILLSKFPVQHSRERLKESLSLISELARPSCEYLSRDLPGAMFSFFLESAN